MWHISRRQDSRRGLIIFINSFYIPIICVFQRVPPLNEQLCTLKLDIMYLISNLHRHKGALRGSSGGLVISSGRSQEPEPHKQWPANTIHGGQMWDKPSLPPLLKIRS